MKGEKSSEVTYKTPKKIRVLIGFLVILVIILGVWIKNISDLKNVITLPPYQFTDINSLVTASGSWLSADTDLANPLQTLEIQCWQDFGHCFANYGEIAQYDGNSTGSLNSFSDLYEISRWTDEIIETKPSKTLFGCVETSLRMDRRSKTVTYTRKTINNKGNCEGVDDAPFTLILGDGLKRLRQAR